MMIHLLLLEYLSEDGHLRVVRFLDSFEDGIHVVNSRLRPLNLDFGHHEVYIEEVFLLKLDGYRWLSLCNSESLTIILIRSVNKIEVIQSSNNNIPFLRWVFNALDHVYQIVGLNVSDLRLNRILVIGLARNSRQLLDFTRSLAIFTAEG